MVHEYIYLVPFVQKKDEIFLKTSLSREGERNMNEKYTEEESEILEALEKNQISLEDPSSKEHERVRTAATESLKKSKRITIRLYEHDYIAIQEKASEIGIPYQTLISSLIHRYVEGDMIPKHG